MSIPGCTRATLACLPSPSLAPSAAFEQGGSPVWCLASEGHAKLVSSPGRFSSSSGRYGKAILRRAARRWPDWSKNASAWPCIPKPPNGVYGAIIKWRRALDERQRARIATLARNFPRTEADPGIRSVTVKVFAYNYISTFTAVDFDAIERWKPNLSRCSSGRC